jgi:hypothetical protein
VKHENTLLKKAWPSKILKARTSLSNGSAHITRQVETWNKTLRVDETTEHGRNKLLKLRVKLLIRQSIVAYTRMEWSRTITLLTSHIMKRSSLLSLIASEELIFLSSHKMYYALRVAFFSLLMRCIAHYMRQFSLFSWDVLCITRCIFLSSHEMYYALQGTFFSLLMRCIMHDMVLSVIWIVRDKWEIPSFGFWSTWAHSFGFVLFSFC